MKIPMPKAFEKEVVVVIKTHRDEDRTLLKDEVIPASVRDAVQTVIAYFPQFIDGRWKYMHHLDTQTMFYDEDIILNLTRGIDYQEKEKEVAGGIIVGYDENTTVGMLDGVKCKQKKEEEEQRWNLLETGHAGFLPRFTPYGVHDRSPYSNGDSEDGEVYVEGVWYPLRHR